MFVCNSHHAAANCLHKHSTYIMHKMATMKSLYVYAGFAQPSSYPPTHTAAPPLATVFYFSLWDVAQNICALRQLLCVCVFKFRERAQLLSMLAQSRAAVCCSDPIIPFFPLSTIFRHKNNIPLCCSPSTNIAFTFLNKNNPPHMKAYCVALLYPAREWGDETFVFTGAPGSPVPISHPSQGRSREEGGWQRTWGHWPTRPTINTICWLLDVVFMWPLWSKIQAYLLP